ncbi:UNVERIFIED_CONTAM: E3 ubiquitin-protein ligase RHF2A [Sesamum radiatum]|uniref:RING-type E3 ubiquitin transferase n=1 Tax=Sesamum radiatum TaxID=300843 RepID=A0AAW2KP03_SESRA
MDEVKKTESHMTSAAAFVEGGIQDACDDACSICLEAFSDSDPSTVTSCKHEFHLQCILEWCQRSSNCPMCWQSVSLKDPASQELLEAVEQERAFRFAPSRNAAIFHHPTLGDFELQHLPVGVNDPELEERIIQHLAAAAAMGRTRRIARREGSRSRSSAHSQPQFVVFSANPNSSSTAPVSASLSPGGAETEPAATTGTSPSSPLVPSSVQSNQVSASSSRSFFRATTCQGIANDNRYKESISRSTRGWKEKLFSRSSSMADIGSGVRREVNAGIATVSRMMECLETRDNNSAGRVPLANNLVDPSVTGCSNHGNRETPNETPSNGNNSTSFAASPV